MQYWIQTPFFLAVTPSLPGPVNDASVSWWELGQSNRSAVVCKMAGHIMNALSGRVFSSA